MMNMILFFALLTLFKAASLSSLPMLLTYLFWGALSLKFFTSLKAPLLALLLLEVLVLTTLTLILMPMTGLPLPSFVFLSFFTLAACEASFGLSLLILFSRQSKSALSPSNSFLS